MKRVPAPLTASARVWTIGHSNSSAHQFVDALRAHGIEAVADVRRFPGSRKHPQFGGPALAETLAAHGIDYAWLAKLGGRRRDDPGIRQPGWRNPSFRSYAAFMWSDEFAEGLGELTNVAHAMPTAVMCSAAVVALPSRAHLRCAAFPGPGGRPHHAGRRGKAASLHGARADRRWRAGLPRRAATASLLRPRMMRALRT